MRWHTAQFLDPAVTGEPAGIAHQLSESRMVRMLIFNQARREDNARPHAPNDACQFDGVSNTNFKVRIAVQFDKFKPGTQEHGGPVRLNHPLSRRAVGSSFAARANHELRCATSVGFFRNDTATPKLDVVRVCAKGQ